MSAFRAYLYNLNTRKEMIEHPANGKTWLATEGMLFKDGAFVPDTTTGVEVAAYANLYTVKGRQMIKADQFDHPVAVKVWYGPGNVEWRKLVAA